MRCRGDGAARAPEITKPYFQKHAQPPQGVLFTAGLLNKYHDRFDAAARSSSRCLLTGALPLLCAGRDTMGAPEVRPIKRAQPSAPSRAIACSLCRRARWLSWSRARPRAGCGRFSFAYAYADYVTLSFVVRCAPCAWRGGARACTIPHPAPCLCTRADVTRPQVSRRLLRECAATPAAEMASASSCPSSTSSAPGARSAARSRARPASAASPACCLPAGCLAFTCRPCAFKRAG